MHTDPQPAGSFSCSNELFNKINEVYLRTQKNNFHGSISSDCPHRERLAYTGDAQVVVESSILSFDMTQFCRKWFDDMGDARNRKSGYVPHTAPFGGGGGGPAWGSAYVIMPWAYYCYYGDTVLLNRHYEGMKQWVAYPGNKDRRPWNHRPGRAGWLVPGGLVCAGEEDGAARTVGQYGLLLSFGRLDVEGCGCLRERGRQTAL
ncbi:hypothetical protein NXW71_11735 [Parabacteroides merdae]|nr:hypothetical protein [Parabacteroides merdae]